MKNEDIIFKELEQLLDGLGIGLKFRKGYFKGGLCRYRDDKYIYLNRTDKKEHQISIILSELEDMDLEGIKLPQTIKELLSKSEA